MMSDGKPKAGNPVDQALMQMIGGLAGLASAAIPPREDADPQSLSMVAEFVGVEADTLRNDPENTREGLTDLAAELGELFQGLLSDDPAMKARSEQLQDGYGSILKAHGIDIDAQKGRLERTMGALSGADDRLKGADLVSGLRRIASVLEGGEEGPEDDDQLTRLSEALQSVGQDLLGIDPERDAETEREEIRKEAALKISARLKKFGFE
jgi:hypothetical protein